MYSSVRLPQKKPKFSPNNPQIKTYIYCVDNRIFQKGGSHAIVSPIIHLPRPLRAQNEPRPNPSVLSLPQPKQTHHPLPKPPPPLPKPHFPLPRITFF